MSGVLEYGICETCGGPRYVVQVARGSLSEADGLYRLACQCAPISRDEELSDARLDRFWLARAGAA